MSKNYAKKIKEFTVDTSRWVRGGFGGESALRNGVGPLERSIR